MVIFIGCNISCDSAQSQVRRRHHIGDFWPLEAPPGVDGASKSPRGQYGEPDKGKEGRQGTLWSWRRQIWHRRVPI